MNLIFIMQQQTPNLGSDYSEGFFFGLLFLVSMIFVAILVVIIIIALLKRGKSKEKVVIKERIIEKAPQAVERKYFAVPSECPQWDLLGLK